jgi:hypothetical protein
LEPLKIRLCRPTLLKPHRNFRAWDQLLHNLDKLPETRLVTERESEMIHLLACQLQHFVEGDCRRFVDHYISSNDRLVIRLGCSNSHAVGAR